MKINKNKTSKQNKKQKNKKKTKKKTKEHEKKTNKKKQTQTYSLRGALPPFVWHSSPDHSALKRPT